MESHRSSGNGNETVSSSSADVALWQMVSLGQYEGIHFATKGDG